MYDDVLIPVDRGEESNLTAIDEVLDFIHKSENGVIRLLYVWTSEREQESSITTDTTHPHPITHAKNYIENTPVTVDITCETRTGNPAEEISEHADIKNVDTIVMATYGRSRVKRMLLGSTTESVIKQSTPPVLVVNRD
jgi:nucleotide-binding universal stress UspA family protein